MRTLTTPLVGELLEEAAPERLTKLIDELDTDDAADVLAQLDDDVREKVLPALEDADDIRDLMAYDEETAGGIMATELVAVPPGWTVAQATEEVRRNAETVEEIFVIFVVDGEGRLQGFVSLKRLLLSPSEAAIGLVMRTDVHSVTTDIDQEDVVRIMERYDLVSLAVTDDARRLVGRITIDDAIDVAREEAEEDYQRLSGITGDEEPTDSVARITRGRLPWLFLGLVGAGVCRKRHRCIRRNHPAGVDSRGFHTRRHGYGGQCGDSEFSHHGAGPRLRRRVVGKRRAPAR